MWNLLQNLSIFSRDIVQWTLWIQSLTWGWGAFNSVWGKTQVKMTETLNVNTNTQKMLCTTVIIICNMPLAPKLKKKKHYFARLSLIIMITSFNRIWHLRELVFIKGARLSSKVGLAAFRYLLYDASLDAHGSVLKKKMKLHETAGNEKIKQE